jgi:hypothetical protein
MSLKTLDTNYYCSITKLSDDSLQVAYDHAVLEELDPHFIQLLETEIIKRNKTASSKNVNLYNVFG